MAVRFLIAFILVSCGASAQVFQTNNVPYKFRGLKADSMLVVPSGTDTANLANPKWGENMNGALFAKTGDSTLWMKVGTRWVKVTGTSLDTISLSNRINQKVDSITSSNDSLYYYVNGTQYYVSSFTGFDTAVVVKAQVHNAEATTLLAGEVVYGFSSTGNLLSVKRANNKLESTSSKTFGIVRKDIPAGGIGWIVTNGVVDKLNLGAYTAGQEVYLDSINGQFTATKPLAPYNMVFVGIIERANAGNGQLYVKIQNGFELYELHNVSARFPSNNQVLKFRASDSLWHNATDTGITSLTAGVGLTGGTITTTGTIAADTNVLSTRAWRQKGLDSLSALELSLADTAAMLTNYPRGTGTANQVAFWNGTRSLSGSNNFTFNNRRVGIGTSAPSSTLQVFQNTIDSNLTAINVSGYNITQNNAQSAVDISGTWNTTGTPTLIKANVTNTASNANSLLMDLQSSGISRFRITQSGIVGNTSVSDYLGFRLNFTGTIATTSGTQNTITSSINIAPTSGTLSYNNINVSNTINQTGGANGITRGLYVNPTLTSAADWRSVEWSNNTGFGLYGAGTASNALAGPTTIGAAASPSASAVLDLTSTTRGFLPPRMTAAQRTGIANAAGLLVWDSDSARYLLNNGTSWRGLAYTGEGGGLTTDSIYFRKLGNPFRAYLSVGAGPGGTGTVSGTTLNNRNIAIGDSAIRNVTTAQDVIAIGFRSGQQITTGSQNIGIGNFTLGSTSGAAFTGVGNIAIGNSVRSQTGPLRNITSGSYNTVIGSNAQNTSQFPAGDAITSGNNNTLIGGAAGSSLTTQSDNTFVGFRAGLVNTSSFSTLIGSQAAHNSTSGVLTAIGYQAGLTNTTGSGVFIGRQAMAGSPSGPEPQVSGTNIAIGSNSARFVGSGSSVAISTTRNTIIGNEAGPLSISTAINDNVFLGHASGNNFNNGSGTSITGSQNIAIGSTSTLMNLSSGYQFVLGSGNNAVNRWMISDTVGTSRRWVINGSTTSVSATTAGAALDVQSTTGSFLPPKMTGAQAEAINGAAPPEGSLIYCTNGNGVTITSKGWWGYDGTTWVKLN